MNKNNVLCAQWQLKMSKITKWENASKMICVQSYTHMHTHISGVCTEYSDIYNRCEWYPEKEEWDWTRKEIFTFYLSVVKIK